MRNNFVVVGIILSCAALLLASPAPSACREKDTKQIVSQRMEEGENRFAEKDYHGAIDAWTEIVVLDPWNETARLRIEEALAVVKRITETIDEGYRLLNEGELDRAREVLSAAKEMVSPKDKKLYDRARSGLDEIEERKNRQAYQGYLARGDASLAGGRFEEALTSYSRAKELDPGKEQASKKIERANRAKRIAELRESAVRDFENGDYTASREKWNELLAIDPRDQDAPLYLSKLDYRMRGFEQFQAMGKSCFTNAESLHGEKRYAEAIDQFENAIALNYRAEDARLLIAAARAEMAELERVETETTRARVAQSLREGIRLYNIDEYGKSLSVLQEGFKLDPENTQVKEYIVRDIVALKREEEKKVPPDSPFYKLVMNLERLGADAFERGEYRESITYFERILLIFPFNEAARVNLTKALGKTDPALARDILAGTFQTAKDLYAQKGGKREAAAKLELILTVDPGFAPARELRDRIEAETREAKGAAAGRDEAQAAELYSRGSALYTQNRLGEAIGLWRRSLELNPDNVEARVSLSRAESELRHRENRAAEDSSPPNMETRIRMKKHYLDGINYYMDGLYREAISEWEAILKVDPDYENVKTNIDRARRRLMYGAERRPSDLKS